MGTLQTMTYKLRSKDLHHGNLWHYLLKSLWNLTNKKQWSPNRNILWATTTTKNQTSGKTKGKCVLDELVPFRFKEPLSHREPSGLATALTLSSALPRQQDRRLLEPGLTKSDYVLNTKLNESERRGRPRHPFYTSRKRLDAIPNHKVIWTSNSNPDTFYLKK